MMGQALDVELVEVRADEGESLGLEPARVETLVRRRTAGYEAKWFVPRWAHTVGLRCSRWSAEGILTQRRKGIPLQGSAWAGHAETVPRDERLLWKAMRSFHWRFALLIPSGERHGLARAAWAASQLSPGWEGRAVCSVFLGAAMRVDDAFLALPRGWDRLVGAGGETQKETPRAHLGEARRTR